MGPFTYTPFRAEKSDAEPSAVFEFIQEMNFADAGMVKMMHQLALKLLRQDILHGLPEDTVDAMLQIIILLEQSFMETISLTQNEEPLEVNWFVIATLLAFIVLIGSNDGSLLSGFVNV